MMSFHRSFPQLIFEAQMMKINPMIRISNFAIYFKERNWRTKILILGDTGNLHSQSLSIRRKLSQYFSFVIFSGSIKPCRYWKIWICVKIISPKMRITVIRWLVFDVRFVKNTQHNIANTDMYSVTGLELKLQPYHQHHQLEKIKNAIPKANKSDPAWNLFCIIKGINPARHSSRIGV